MSFYGFLAAPPVSGASALGAFLPIVGALSDAVWEQKGFRAKVSNYLKVGLNNIIDYIVMVFSQQSTQLDQW